jgi:hypothetical protein
LCNFSPPRATRLPESFELHVLLKKLGLFAAGAGPETRDQGDKYVIETQDK